MRKMTLFSLLILSFSLSAKEIKLFDMQVVNEEKITPLRLIVDKHGEAQGMKFDEEGKDVFVSVSEVTSRKGAVVMEYEGHKLAYLQSNDLDTLRGGNFRLKYIKNVLFKSDGEKQFSLEYDGKTWAAFHNGEQIKKLFVQPGSMGIKNIAIK